MVEQLNKAMTPNGRHIPIDINAASLPRQVCLKLESAGLGADIERLHQVQEAEEASLASGVAARIDRIFEAGNYVVFRHEMILQNNVDLPEWFDEVVGALDPAQRPKLFRCRCLSIAGRHASTSSLNSACLAFQATK